MLHQELEESWRGCSIQTTCPKNRRNCAQMWWTAQEREKLWLPWPLWVIFRPLRGFSFEDIHPNVYIFCHLMLLLMIIHSSSRVTSARPLGLWSFPQEMFLLLEAVLWLLGSSALSSRAALWGPRCFLLLLCQQGFEEMGFSPGEIDRLHLTFKLSSRIKLPLREQEEDRAAFSSSYSPLPEFSSRDFSFSSVSFSLSNFASSQTKRAAIPIWTFN